MLCVITVLLQILTMIQSRKADELDWWQTAVFYQIYPRSFKDSDGDGVGDFRGITEKLHYLKDAGVNAVWLMPIFESPMMNFGYDISNYTATYYLYGTMGDLLALKEKAHSLGLKVILDLPVNHVSIEMDWFKKSVQKIEPYTDYFVWENGKVDKDGREIPPSNWLSVYGASAWTKSEERQQYYLHQFSSYEADLNYRNPPVFEEMKAVMKFWLDKGFDGFRIHAPYFLVENVNVLDEPIISESRTNFNKYEHLSHIYTINQPESLSLAQEWRSLLETYKEKDGQTRIVMTEGYGEDQFFFVGTVEKPGVHIVLNFDLINKLSGNSSAQEFKDAIDSSLNSSQHFQTWNNWQLSNQGTHHIASRFGDDLVDGMHMILHWLPGSSFSYSGDEIGQTDTHLSPDHTTLLHRKFNQYSYSGREPYSTPFQWNSSTSAGFSNNSKTWLPVNKNYLSINLLNQINSPKSHFMIYKILVTARKSCTLQRGSVDVQVLSEKVLAFTRTLDGEPPYVVVINLGSEIETVNLTAFYDIPDSAMVIAASENSGLILGAPQTTSFMVLFPKMSVALVAGEIMEISSAAVIRMSNPLFFPMTCSVVILLMYGYTL